jgi:ATP-dependent Zn protease
MGTQLVIPYNSDKYKEYIDDEINSIFNDAYIETKKILSNSKQLIHECANLLVIKNELKQTIHLKYTFANVILIRQYLRQNIFDCLFFK